MNTDKTRAEEIKDDVLDDVTGGGPVPTEQISMGYTEVEWTYAKGGSTAAARGNAGSKNKAIETTWKIEEGE